MNMLARAIPEELRTAMSAPNAIDLGWARNFSYPDGTHRWGYPGWNLLKQHCSVADVARVLDEYNQEQWNVTVKAGSTGRRPVLSPESWDELETAVKGQGYPILQGLMLILAKATGKTVYVTNVYLGDGAGVFDGIDVYHVTPEGRCIRQQV